MAEQCPKCWHPIEDSRKKGGFPEQAAWITLTFALVAALALVIARPHLSWVCQGQPSPVPLTIASLVINEGSSKLEKGQMVHAKPLEEDHAKTQPRLSLSLSFTNPLLVTLELPGLRERPQKTDPKLSGELREKEKPKPRGPSIMFGLDLPTFGRPQYDEDGALRSVLGLNLGLGISYRSYIAEDGLKPNRFNFYWGTGTIVLFLPYFEVGATYPFNMDTYRFFCLSLGAFLFFFIVPIPYIMVSFWL